MAKKAEILELFEFLLTVYPPGSNQEETFNRHLPGLVDVWARAFADTPAPVLRLAADLYMVKGKWFPKPAEILDQIPEADRQVSREEQSKAASGLIDGLRQRLLELESVYWHSGEFDCDAWEALINDFDSAGWSANANHCREFAEMAGVADAVEIPLAVEIAA